jgi:hypothetical protein
VDTTKPFDPWAQVAEMQRWMADNFPSFKAALDASPLRYQAIDPTIQEIAVLATMHNMASTLRDSGEIKAAIAAAIKERASKLS